jgi:hypothetical protein
MSQRYSLQIDGKRLIQVLFALVIALSLISVGLALRPATVSTQTLMQTQYVTEAQAPVTSVQTQTVTSTSMGTVTESVTSADQPYVGFNGYCASSPFQQCPYPYNNPNCGYPFNPYLCNEGPPVTVTGYLSNDSSCVFLYASGTNYVVWNLPQTYPQGAYEVYGFSYPNWPAGTNFPPYPFQEAQCVGIPIWAISPYVSTA